MGVRTIEFTTVQEAELLQAHWRHFQRARENVEIALATFCAARGAADYEVEGVTEQGVVVKAPDA